MIASALPFHRISQIWDPWTPAQIEEFKTSVEEFGQLDPVSVWRGEVVDGKNRCISLKEMGREPRTDALPDEWEEDRVYKYVCAKHLRREESEVQKRHRIARQVRYERELAKERQREAGGDKKSDAARANAEFAEIAAENRLGSKEPDRSGTAKGRAAEIVAKQNDMSVTAVKRIVAVEERGSPDLKAAVDQKAVSVTKAAEIVRKSATPAEQNAKLAEAKGEEPPALVAEVPADPTSAPPAHLASVFDSVTVARGLLQRLTKWEGDFDEACHAPGFRRIADKLFTRKSDLEAIRKELQAHVPYGVCPLCEGKPKAKCETCDSLGWVNKATFRRLCPEESRASVYRVS